MRKILVAGMLFAAGLASAHAEYPERPITMLVAYSAGGGTDVAARTLAPYISKYLGNDASIVVVNKPGAGGEVGFTELALAKPDGYTIGFINTPNMLTIPIARKARYTLDSFAPIANVVDDLGAFSVLPSRDMKDLKDLVAYAKANPGKVTYGSTGIGSDDHLAGLSFERLAGVKMKHVPFQGSAKMRAAVLGGHIMLASMNISEAIAEVDEGKLVALGQMGEKRWSGAPNVPTFKQQGFDIVMGSMRGVAAPAGVDKAIIAKIDDAIKKAIDDPEFQEKAKAQKLPLAYIGSAEYEKVLRYQDNLFKQLWKEDPWVKQ